MASKTTKQRRAVGAMMEEGRILSENPGRIRKKSNRRWRVRSGTFTFLWHHVIFDALGMWCSCSLQENPGLCRHIAAVEHVIARSWDAAKKIAGRTIKIMKLPEQCHYCRSLKFVRNGHRKIKRGWIQRYLCRSCGRSFSGMPGFKGRHTDPKTIVRVLKAVVRGLSCASAQSILADEGTVVHESTVYRWAAHYSAMMEGYARGIGPRTGHKWHCDEIYFRIRGEARYLFTVMDGRSRFILSNDISPTKFGYDPLNLFVAARTLAGTAPWIFVTDGLKSFLGAARKAFRRGAGFRLIHIREIHMKEQFNNNNPHERLNGEFKDRLKTARGFGAENPALVRLSILHHNFFRPHLGIGKRTPAEMAGITIQGDDKWITFIHNAALSAA